MNTKLILVSTGVLLLLMLSSGCSLVQIDEESDQIDQMGIIEGVVNIEGPSENSVYVVLFEQKAHSLELANRYTLQDEGRYVFNVSPGIYKLAAYQDENGDGRYQRNERAAILGGDDADSAVEVVIKEREQLRVEPITIARPLTSSKQDNDTFDIADNHTGKVVSLDDPRFDREIGALGLWKPNTFLKDYGWGLYLLQPYDPGLVPVIFIHGAGGNPREFSALVERIDKSRYQAWVFHYPSGYDLGAISSTLVSSLNQLEASYGFHRFGLIAHSMGGLVMRSAIMSYFESSHDAQIELAISINSPMLGMESAAVGVDMSPIVVPSWHDVARGSAFINKVMQWKMPDAVPYYLIFSYQRGEGDDGVVPLHSQLPMKLQDEARRIYGFNAGHADILRNPEFLDRFAELMNQVALAGN